MIDYGKARDNLKKALKELSKVTGKKIYILIDEAIMDLLAKYNFPLKNKK